MARLASRRRRNWTARDAHLPSGRGQPATVQAPEGRTDTALTSYAIEGILHRALGVSEDWKHPSAETIVANCMRDMRPGAIVVLHDGSGDYPDTAPYPALLDASPQGYTFIDRA